MKEVRRTNHGVESTRPCTGTSEPHGERSSPGARSERAIREGEIELRGTIAAEKGGLHMGWNGTDGVSASAARCRKCLEMDSL